MKGSPARTYRMKASTETPVKSVAPLTPVKTELQKAQDSETHESIKFILFAVTSGLVALAIYLN